MASNTVHTGFISLRMHIINLCTTIDS